MGRGGAAHRVGAGIRTRILGHAVGAGKPDSLGRACRGGWGRLGAVVRGTVMGVRCMVAPVRRFRGLETARGCQGAVISGRNTACARVCFCVFVPVCVCVFVCGCLGSLRSGGRWGGLAVVVVGWRVGVGGGMGGRRGAWAVVAVRFGDSTGLAGAPLDC